MVRRSYHHKAAVGAAARKNGIHSGNTAIQPHPPTGGAPRFAIRGVRPTPKRPFQGEQGNRQAAQPHSPPGKLRCNTTPWQSTMPPCPYPSNHPVIACRCGTRVDGVPRLLTYRHQTCEEMTHAAKVNTDTANPVHFSLRPLRPSRVIASNPRVRTCGRAIGKKYANCIRRTWAACIMTSGGCRGNAPPPPSTCRRFLPRPAVPLAGRLGLALPRHCPGASGLLYPLRGTGPTWAAGPGRLSGRPKAGVRTWLRVEDNPG